jgi:hypothetical protein
MQVTNVCQANYFLILDSSFVTHESVTADSDVSEEHAASVFRVDRGGNTFFWNVFALSTTLRHHSPKSHNQTFFLLILLLPNREVGLG